MNIALSSFATTALALALAACSQPPQQAAAPRPVEVMTVGAPSSYERQVYSGEVRARHEADLGFRVAGKLLKRHVDVGSAVKKGQVLAELDPADLQLSAEASRAQVAAAQTEFDFARAELERYRSLLQQKFISQAAFDARQNAYNATAARLEQARSQHAVTRNQAGYATLVADTEGVITAAAAEPGQVLAAGQPVLRLARLGEKEVLIAVPENRLPEFRAATAIAVATWSQPGKIYRGALRELAPAADSATRTYAAKISIVDADAEVLWGMTANVLLQSTHAGAIVRLPLGAIAQREQQPVVWVADANSATVNPRPVRVGQYGEDGVSILEGLRAGELVVTAGVHKLLPGQQVRLPQAAAPAAKVAAARVTL